MNIQRRAFTLIELLVVISIIALLIAIILPVLASTKETTRRIICASNEHQWSIALVSYAVEENGRYPSGRLDIFGNLRPGVFSFLTKAEMLSHAFYEFTGGDPNDDNPNANGAQNIDVDFWSCPNVVLAGGSFPYYFDAGNTNRWVIQLGYQYFGDGDAKDINWTGWSGPSHAPVGPEDPGEWNLFADWAYRVNWSGFFVTRLAGHLVGGGGQAKTLENDNVFPWGVDREIDGGNQLYNDGSASYAKYAEMDQVWRIPCCHQSWVYR